MGTTLLKDGYITNHSCIVTVWLSTSKQDQPAQFVGVYLHNAYTCTRHQDKSVEIPQLSSAQKFVSGRKVKRKTTTDEHDYSSFFLLLPQKNLLRYLLLLKWHVFFSNLLSHTRVCDWKKVDTSFQNLSVNFFVGGLSSIFIFDPLIIIKYELIYI